VDFLSNWDTARTLENLLTLSAAYVLALPIGWNREKEERSAGLRTFPLVAMAACGFVMIAVGVLGEGTPEQGMVMQGLITGVGFIGGGAILKQGDRATGTATAASLWATGAIGVAVGYGLFDVGLILSGVIYLTLRFLSPLKSALNLSEDSAPAAGDGQSSSPQAAGGDAEDTPESP
jgi:putative Mg2+ transporter-C (MgtC) family protein